MLYSIIIINYKTPQLTIDCIRSILTLPNKEEKEIIVIDNDSNDNSTDILRDAFIDRVTIIENNENKGFSFANNQGAKIATGNFLLFLNSDTIINEDIFSSATELFQNNKDIAVISPRLKLENGNKQPFAYGLFPTLWRLITKKTKKETKIKEDEKTLEVDWVSACALFIKKDVFQEINGFDENFFLYFEDVDLCKRVKVKGYKVIIDNSTSIIHLGGRSIKLHQTRKKYYYESQDYYFKKHHSFISQFGIKGIRVVIVLTRK
jgi:GT2 family glycosyltransferase